MKVIAYVCFLKDAHSVSLCRLFDDLFYFAKVFVKPENALFCFKREVDRKSCGDWALAFGIALKAFSAEGVFGALRPLNSNCFYVGPYELLYLRESTKPSLLVQALDTEFEK